jgi:hypothetical protein
MQVAAGTVVSNSYLPFARVLGDSLRQAHPEVPLYVAFTDDIGGRFDPATESFRSVRADDLAIPRPERFRFRYTLKQAAVAMKPFLLSHLLDQGFDGVLWLDPDVLVMHHLGPFLTAAARQAVVLAPHLLKSVDGPRAAEEELIILRAGVFNGGALSVSPSPAAREFLRWWERRMTTHCLFDVAQGMHYDQRWLDLAPTVCGDVHVLRDPACNVAYWNLAERALTVDGDAVLTGGVPCRFFHFSGFDPDEPRRPTRYRPEMTFEDVRPAEGLFRRYHELLVDAGWAETRTWASGYSSFSDGVPIPAVARELYRSVETSARFADPFDASAPDGFRHWLDEPVDGQRRGRRPVTRLWHAIWRRRPDVQRAYPSPLGRDRNRFLAWTSAYGCAEHDIAEVLVR